MIKALEPRTEDGWSEEKHKEKAKAQAWLHLATAAGVLLILAALVSHGSVSIVVMWGGCANADPLAQASTVCLQVVQEYR